jgi:phosphoglycerol transferase MdoB-like AlkP superfamily enzyme
MVLKEFSVGLFFDGLTFSYAAVPFALYLALVPERFFLSRWNRAIVHGLTFVLLYLLVFISAAEYFFFQEFGTRFNFIAVDYLIYTREVIGNIRESYQLTPILAALLAVTAGIYAAVRQRLSLALQAPGHPVAVRLRTGFVYTVVPLLAFSVVGQPLTAISQNQYANEISQNGIYDFFAAFRNNELDYDRFYPTRDEADALNRIRHLVDGPYTRFTAADGRSILRQVAMPGPEKRLNVIVVVEESLSAEYLGVFGHRGGLTPNLDRLSGESLFFTRMYATGTRTVRGLEALTLSLPPLPGISIVKRPDNAGFRSWGAVMREKGYDTKYLYAGYGYFDNMNAFFSGNGFDIVDRSSFSADEITFANIWGVCDEDLFRKVTREATRSYQRGKPFFSVVMTTSNHRPYTYPEGRIDIPPKTGRDGGVKYADYALGRLISEARTQPWFRDTVFVIVADHCASSAGRSEVPVNRYEIPLLIYAPAHVRPGRVETVASQIDIAPTVLGLLQMSYTSSFVGRDLLAPAAGLPPRAFLSTYQKLAFLEGDRLVVISPQKQVRTYAYDRSVRSLREAAAPEDVVADALAYYQGANYLYKNRLNRIEGPER